MEPLLPGRRHQGPDFIRAVEAIDRCLHSRVKILYPHAQAVESQLSQTGNTFHRGIAGMDLDGVLAAVIIAQVEVAANGSHQSALFIITDIGGSAATPVQLVDRPRGVEQISHQRHLAVQPLKIGARDPPIGGDNPVAGAVVTNAAAKGDMKIQR